MHPCAFQSYSYIVVISTSLISWFSIGSTKFPFQDKIFRCSCFLALLGSGLIDWHPQRFSGNFCICTASVPCFSLLKWACVHVFTLSVPSSNNYIYAIRCFLVCASSMFYFLGVLLRLSLRRLMHRLKLDVYMCVSWCIRIETEKLSRRRARLTGRYYRPFRLFALSQVPRNELRLVH